MVLNWSTELNSFLTQNISHFVDHVACRLSIWNYQTDFLSSKFNKTTQISHQSSTVLLFRITRLGITRERIENRLYISSLQMWNTKQNYLEVEIYNWVVHRELHYMTNILQNQDCISIAGIECSLLHWNVASKKIKTGDTNVNIAVRQGFY